MFFTFYYTVYLHYIDLHRVFFIISRGSLRGIPSFPAQGQAPAPRVEGFASLGDACLRLAEVSRCGEGLCGHVRFAQDDVWWKIQTKFTVCMHISSSYRCHSMYFTYSRLISSSSHRRPPPPSFYIITQHQHTLPLIGRQHPACSHTIEHCATSQIMKYCWWKKSCTTWDV